jgi:hypothetical protein
MWKFFERFFEMHRRQTAFLVRLLCKTGEIMATLDDIKATVATLTVDITAIDVKVAALIAASGTSAVDQASIDEISANLAAADAALKTTLAK